MCDIEVFQNPVTFQTPTIGQHAPGLKCDLFGGQK